MTKVNIQEAKTHLSRYIDRVLQGDVIILCRHNQPVAELRAVETSPVRRARVAGLLKGQVHWEPGAFAAMTDEELAEFDRTPVFPRPRQA
jgi:prevent-host-death family protein